MTPEQKLDLLLGRAAPPARDFGFQADLAQRVALRRAWWRAAALLPWLMISCVVMWALGPYLTDQGPKLVSALALPVGALTGSTLLVICILWLTQRLSRSG